jgi:Tsi6
MAEELDKGALRKEFDGLLAECKEIMGRFLARNPDFPPYLSVGRQLRALSEWTANGQLPNKEECDSLDFDLVAVREFEPSPDPALQQFAQKLYRLAYVLEELTGP